MRSRSIVTLIFAAILGLSAAGISAAADVLLDRASALLREGKPKEAFRLLDPKEDQRAGDIEFDYLLGVAAVDAGSPERAVVAFERVLTLNPDHEGARLDLARAYYALGSDDLARQEFNRVLEKNPPPAARAAINQYFETMDKRKRALTTRISAYVEGLTGYDSNLTSSTSEFTSAVLSSFNIAGVQPTGNSIKRSGSFFGVATGIDVQHKINTDFSVYGGADARRRDYNENRDFGSDTFDVRGGVQYTREQHILRGGLQAQRYYQEGAAPTTPKVTNDRESSGVAFEYKYALAEDKQLGAYVQGNDVSYPTNPTQDTRQTVYGITGLKLFPEKGNSAIFASLYRIEDRARNNLIGGSNVGRDVTGLRLVGQYSLRQDLDVFALFGYADRRDRSPFARSTVVEMGGDQTADASLGLTWRFRPQWNLRAQATFIDNRSNIPLYIFDRSEYSLAVRYDFR